MNSEGRVAATTPVDPGRTVAEILEAHPWARPVLRAYGLDSCCGGAHPLEVACRAHRIEVGAVLEALRAAAPAAVVPAPEAGAEPPCAPCAARARATSAAAISAESCVREVIAAHPATLDVFDRFGLMGCGGPAGPDEPIGWFARVHHVDVEILLEALRAAAARPAAPDAKAAAAAGPAGTLYRRFLKAALLFTFTGGTALGAWALLVMGQRGHLGGIGRGVIQVHGHWQLFGWVGLFVVGVAYHILPRLTGKALPSYRAAAASFVLLAAGTVMRTGQSLDPSAAREALLFGGALLELAGCGLFAWTVARTLGRGAEAAAPWRPWLGLGTAWLVLACLLNLTHVAYLARTGAFEVPPWMNVPYLTVFLVGFVTFWIVGVSLRTLPVFMGVEARPRLAAALPLPLTLAVAAMTVGESRFLAGDGDAARLLFGAGGAAVALLLAAAAIATGVLSPARGARETGVDRGYEKFLRLGYAWLVVSCGMLAVFSVLVVLGRDMDHALVGAYRHALTVGFITTVMVGMASRLVPIFRGVPLHSLRLREWTFWLLLSGNAIRVVFQSLSAFGGPVWLRVAGISGILELSALVLFGYNLWRTLDAPEAASDAAPRPVPIAGETLVGELLLARPDLLPVFVRHGFTALANPWLRKTVARGVSIRHACRMHGVDLQRFLGALQEAPEPARP